MASTSAQGTTISAASQASAGAIKVERARGDASAASTQACRPVRGAAQVALQTRARTLTRPRCSGPVAAQHLLARRDDSLMTQERLLRRLDLAHIRE